MRQKSAVGAVCIVWVLLLAPGVFAQDAADGAQTSFDEPTERPDVPDSDFHLPEPALPSAPGTGADPAAPAFDERPEVRIASTRDVIGMVDGESVGAIAAPNPPADIGAGAASLHTVPGLLLEQIDPGTTEPVGARPATVEPVAAAPVHPDPVRPEPDREPDIDLDRDLNVDARWPAVARASGGIVADRQVIAYYGHPMSRFMGILGENALDVMTGQLRARAAEYDAINGEIGVAPAFHIIYGTVYEDASIGILREHKLLEYIEYAREHDLLVFLDHQIGNGTVEEAVRAMLPYLAYEHVHLAFDPEWATDSPGKVIGGVTAQDINFAQQLIQDYLERNGLPGPRMLVVHQFNYRMIESREEVRADFPLVQLIHHADGFGSPGQKRASWRFNVIAENMPLKGFKLFYPKSWRDGGYDDPLMSPAEVMQLEPVPVYIQYQ